MDSLINRVWTAEWWRAEVVHLYLRGNSSLRTGKEESCSAVEKLVLGLSREFMDL